MPRARALTAYWPVVLTVIGGLLAACGGNGAIDDARLHLSLGRLDHADQRLEGATGPAADRLRRQIASARDARAEREAWLAEIRATREERSTQDVLGDLRGALRGEADPYLRELLERALSETADWGAERRSASGHQKAWRPRLGMEAEASGKSVAASAGTPAERDPLVHAIVADVERAVASRSWTEALRLAEMAMEEDAIRASPRLVERLAVLSRDAGARAVDEAEALVIAAYKTRSSDGAAAARRALDAELWRFPNEGRSAVVHRTALLLAESEREERGGESLVRFAMEPMEPMEPREVGGAIAAGAAAGSDPVPPGRSTPTTTVPATSSPDTAIPPATSRDLMQRAASEQDADRLAAAARLWTEAADLAQDTRQRNQLRARALDAYRRAALREELARAFAADAARFAAIEVEAIDEAGVTVAGTRTSWRDVSSGTLAALAKRAELTDSARVGLVLARLARGDVDGPRGAHADLARVIERGLLTEPEAWQLLALARGEELPDGGYRYEMGTWTSAAAADAAERAAAFAKLGERLSTADRSETRDAAYAELVAAGRASRAAREVLAEALAERWRRALKKVERGGILRKLASLSDRRAELDTVRTRALELIFDEERYFYPYAQPAVTAERAAEYGAVQREVDARVAAVREIWEASPEVRLPQSLREGVLELRWLRRRTVHVPGGLVLPEGVPAWALGLPIELDRVDVSSFAWTPEDAYRLARNRAVRAYNESRWSELDRQKGPDVPSGMERQQVAVTNDYRLMLGREALAWNPMLQAACRGHSEYMANSGEFGHFEADEARRTPYDRMRLAGYGRGASENCHMGSGDPRGAHASWVRSSGHHRNLLKASHREMASAAAAQYWTQNFGVDTTFQSKLDLDTWRD